MLNSRTKYAYAHRRGLVILQYVYDYNISRWSLSDVSHKMTKTLLANWIFASARPVKMVSKAKIKELEREADKVPAS